MKPYVRRERRGSRIERSSDPERQRPGSELVVYGSSWCGDCRHLCRFLDRHGVSYHWIDVDWDRQAMERVTEINGGLRSVPTLVFPDRSTLAEPSDAELRRKLGLPRWPSRCAR